MNCYDVHIHTHTHTHIYIYINNSTRAAGKSSGIKYFISCMYDKLKLDQENKNTINIYH